jgi:surfactin synthase thioesterase subunit
VSYLRSWSSTGPDTDLIVVFPPAGGGCMRLRPLAGLQPADRAVCGVQLPGREDRLAEPMPLFDEAVAAIAGELRELPRRRLGLLGISLGGLLAFAVAAALERAGAAADEVSVAAARSPEQWLTYQAERPADEIDAMLGPGWQNSPVGPYAAAVLQRDLGFAAGYDIGDVVLERTALRSVAGRRDVVATVDQMLGWRTRSTDFRGQRVLDVGHQGFVEKDVLEPMINELFAPARPE